MNHNVKGFIFLSTLAIASFLWVGFQYDFFISYETGDDTQLQLIAIGGFWGGEASPQLYQIGLRYGQFIYLANQLLPWQGWYPLSLILCSLIPFTLLFLSILKHSHLQLIEKSCIIFGASILIAEQIFSLQCTHASVMLCMGSSAYLLFNNNLTIARHLIAAALLFLGLDLRLQIGTMAVSFMIMGYALTCIIYRNDYKVKRIIAPILMSGFAYIDYYFFQKNDLELIKFLEMIAPARVVFDFHKLSSEMAHSLGMTLNDYQMISHFFLIDEVRPLLAKVQPIEYQSKWNAFMSLIFSPLSAFTTPSSLSWFVYKFILKHKLFWMIAILTFCYGSIIKDRKKLFVLIFLSFIILYSSYSMSMCYKMVYRLWDPLCLIPLYFCISISAPPCSTKRPLMLHSTIALFFIIAIASVAYHMDYHSGFSRQALSSLSGEVEQLKDEHIYIAPAMPAGTIDPLGSKPLFKHKKLFFLAWMGENPKQMDVLKNLGIDSIARSLLEDKHVFIGLTPRQEGLLVTYYKEHHRILVELEPCPDIKPSSQRALYPFFRVKFIRNLP
jgi:hypothetical protein